MKLKNVQTGEVRDVVSLTYNDGKVTGLYFTGTLWEPMIVQTWDYTALSVNALWVPAKPGLDY